MMIFNSFIGIIGFLMNFWMLLTMAYLRKSNSHHSIHNDTSESEIKLFILSILTLFAFLVSIVTQVRVLKNQSNELLDNFLFKSKYNFGRISFSNWVSILCMGSLHFNPTLVYNDFEQSYKRRSSSNVGALQEE